MFKDLKKISKLMDYISGHLNFIIKLNAFNPKHGYLGLMLGTLVLVFEGLDKIIKIKAEEIKGPKTNAPDHALEGFIKSKGIDNKDLYRKRIEKDEFYFYKTKPKTLKTYDLLREFIPKILENHQWKKN